MSATVPVSPPASDNSAERKRAALASFAGTTIEYYDFFLYGTAAALVFGPQFFPAFSPIAATVAAFGTFAVGFLARPLGGIVMGHYGDRVGRKAMLVISLLLVGCSTIGVGLLPTYAQIGVYAPIGLILLRLIQGLALGGEWSGAVLMAVEHAPAGRRGLFGIFPQMGVPAGLLLGNLAFLVTTALAGPEFAAWAWRIPFLASVILVGVGLLVRLRVTESPEFAELSRRHERSKHPLVEVLRGHPRQILVAAALPIAPIMVFYIATVYLLSYCTNTLHISRSATLLGVLTAGVASLLATPVAGLLCDRIGARSVQLAGCGWLVLTGLVYFPLVDTRSLVGLLLAQAMVGAGNGVTYGPVASLVSGLFPTRVRFSGSSLGYQLGTLVGGAPAPLIAAALYGATGLSVLVGGYMVLAVVLSAAGGLAVASATRAAHRGELTEQAAGAR